MEDRGPWRAFRSLCWDLWGVESEDPDMIEAGDETVISPSLTEPEAKAKAAALNKQAT